MRPRKRDIKSSSLSSVMGVGIDIWHSARKSDRLLLNSMPEKKSANNYAFIDSQNVNLSIRDLGWILDFRRFRKYLLDKYGITKGNCDAELVLQAMIEYVSYDKVVIVTGDGDFYCLVKYLVEKNKLAAVIVP